jgi:hypothetical protein
MLLLEEMVGVIERKQLKKTHSERRPKWGTHVLRLDEQGYDAVQHTRAALAGNNSLLHSG